MSPRTSGLLRAGLIWGGVGVLTLAPIVIAANSPYLSSRNPAYVIAGFAGIACLAVMLVQPLLGAGYLPGLAMAQSRRWHRVAGMALCIGVALHIGGLYLTSPPDALDALLLVSPTPFSIYGVLAMWAVVATLTMFATRKVLPLRPLTWRIIHNVLTALIVIGTIVHALQIDGTMGTVSKWVLCICVAVASAAVIGNLRIGRPLRKRFQQTDPAQR